MKKILISVLVTLSLIFITGCGSKKIEDEFNVENNENAESIKDKLNEDGTLKEEINKNEGVIKEQVVGGITLYNIDLKSTAYSSKLTLIAKNNTQNDIQLDYFKIYLIDEFGNNVLGENQYAVASVFGTIKSGEEVSLIANIDGNLNSVYDIKYEMVK